MDCRGYNPADFDALYALEVECFQPPFRFSRRYLRQLLETREGAARVVEIEGRVGGFGIATWARHRGSMAAYVETLEVAQAERGRGVARRLMSELEAAAMGVEATIMGLHVDALNAAAIALYERCGYSCHGRRENFYPQGRAALVYVKVLKVETPPAAEG